MASAPFQLFHMGAFLQPGQDVSEVEKLLPDMAPVCYLCKKPHEARSIFICGTPARKITIGEPVDFRMLSTGGDAGAHYTFFLCTECTAVLHAFVLTMNVKPEPFAGVDLEGDPPKGE